MEWHFELAIKMPIVISRMKGYYFINEAHITVLAFFCNRVKCARLCGSAATYVNKPPLIHSICRPPICVIVHARKNGQPDRTRSKDSKAPTLLPAYKNNGVNQIFLSVLSCLTVFHTYVVNIYKYQGTFTLNLNSSAANSKYFSGTLLKHLDLINR
jgi:hypothetical protein